MHKNGRRKEPATPKKTCRNMLVWAIVQMSFPMGRPSAMGSRERLSLDGYAPLAISVAMRSSSGLTHEQHPVAGATGKWFAERTIIGKQITESIGKYPDPTQHWAVIVGDYVHQLWMVSLCSALRPPKQITAAYKADEAARTAIWT